MSKQKFGDPLHGQPGTSKVRVQLLIVVKRHFFKSRASTDYTTDDVPPELPVALGKVALQVQESVHYGFNSSAAEVEWGVLQDTLPGEGSVRLGKSNRVFMVSAFHQLHCVQTLYDEIAGKYPGGEYAGHLDHCVDYLRQVILCRPDLTLERGDFTKRDFGNDRLGAIHTCSDWNELYDVVKRDWTRWTTAT